MNFRPPLQLDRLTPQAARIASVLKMLPEGNVSRLKLVMKWYGLGIDFIQKAGEGDSLTNVLYFADPGQSSLQTQPKS